MKKIATNIETNKWNEIISGLTKKGWWVSSKYYGFDAGIDNDFLILRKGLKKIVFGWDNCFEGEIKCDEKLFNYLESEFNIEFKYGKPINLKPMVIFLNKLQSLPLYLIKKFNLL